MSSSVQQLPISLKTLTTDLPDDVATNLPEHVDVEAGLLDLGLQVDPLLLVGCQLGQSVEEAQTGRLEAAVTTKPVTRVDRGAEVLR